MCCVLKVVMFLLGFLLFTDILFDKNAPINVMPMGGGQERGWHLTRLPCPGDRILTFHLSRQQIMY